MRPISVCIPVAANIRSYTRADPLPGAIVSIRTAGEFLNRHPHLHVPATAGAFTADGMISPELVEKKRTWRHSGFHAFAGDEIPDIDDAVRDLLYMARGPATTSRLQADLHQEPKLRYLAKGTGHDHGNTAEPVFHRDFDYLDRVARLTSHIPEKGAQRIHYYGAYSNAHRGRALRRQAFRLPNLRSAT